MKCYTCDKAIKIGDKGKSRGDIKLCIPCADRYLEHVPHPRPTPQMDEQEMQDYQDWYSSMKHEQEDEGVPF